MECVNFYPKEFQEIEEQDNPAFGEDECLMIVKEHSGDEETDRCVVFHIVPSDSEPINPVAIFWNLNVAKLFCETFKAKE